jgi:hypothetical protein
MSAVLIGNMTPATLCPTVALAIAPVGAQLQAQLAGALSLQVQAGIGAPPLTVQKAALLDAVAALELGISLGLPGVTFSVSAAAALVASARAALAGLDVLMALLALPAGFVYAYSGGTLSSLGADVTAGIIAGPPVGMTPSSPVSGFVIGASPATWATVAPFFGGV